MRVTGNPLYSNRTGSDLDYIKISKGRRGVRVVELIRSLSSAVRICGEQRQLSFFSLKYALRSGSENARGAGMIHWGNFPRLLGFSRYHQYTCDLGCVLKKLGACDLGCVLKKLGAKDNQIELRSENAVVLSKRKSSQRQREREDQRRNMRTRSAYLKYSFDSQRHIKDNKLIATTTKDMCEAKDPAKKKKLDDAIDACATKGINDTPFSQYIDCRTIYKMCLVWRIPSSRRSEDKLTKSTINIQIDMIKLSDEESGVEGEIPSSTSRCCIVGPIGTQKNECETGAAVCKCIMEYGAYQAFFDSC
uniref:Uncharacterized protein n=1 Tax=Timema cristinae TaxID=61476 RepID=A0A7R9GWD7_TIMCR|nr:unnamed protein product [Timema cristinae]